MAGLAQELDALQDPGSLTLRERLWKEKEEAADPKDEDVSSAAGGSEGASSSGSSGGSKCGAGEDCGEGGARSPAPNRLQALLAAREQARGRAAQQQQQQGDLSAARESRVHDALAGWAGQRGQQQDSSSTQQGQQGLARFTGRAQPRPDPEVKVLTDEEVAR